tara:strand:- start:13 stop:666 length:654 start_codon:yes stop_codon:yes gene_type:complete
MRLLLGIFVWLLKKLGFEPLKQSVKSSQFEVERKFRLKDSERDMMPQLLKKSGFSYREEQFMTDTFVPASDPSELIRIRDLRVAEKTTSILTLKRWIEVDGERVRQERETESLDPVARDCILEMGSRLAKDALPTLSKERVEYGGVRNGRAVTVTLDTVDGLGAYSGSYMEVEVLAGRSDEVSQALELVDSIAFELLGEQRETSPSYRDMMKESRLS